MSDLIEELGGYEKAKVILQAVGHEHDAMLLEYRRANNIFEVGDKVVYHEKIGIDRVVEVNDEHLIDRFLWQIRHATDKEIKAGRRLSKIKCWSCDKEMSHSDRAENDGFCIHCNAEIEL